MQITRRQKHESKQTGNKQTHWSSETRKNFSINPLKTACHQKTVGIGVLLGCNRKCQQNSFQSISKTRVRNRTFFGLAEQSKHVSPLTICCCAAIGSCPKKMLATKNGRLISTDINLIRCFVMASNEGFADCDVAVRALWWMANDEEHKCR